MFNHFVYAQNPSNGKGKNNSTSSSSASTNDSGNSEQSVVKTYIHVSTDNRVHVYDVDTNKERHVFTEKQHLAHTYTCSAWGSQPSSSSSNNKDKLCQFAVGASDGTIILWDLARGVVSKVIGVAGESPVASDIAFSKDGESILVTHEASGSSLVRYNIVNGQEQGTFKVGKKGSSKISVNPQIDVVAVASSQVRLVDVTSKFKVKFPQHFSGGVTAMQWSPCGRYLVCAGGSRREVVCFDTRSKDGDVINKEPIIVVPVEGIPKSLSVRNLPGKSKALDILCVFEDSNACVFRFTPSDANATRKKGEEVTGSNNDALDDNMMKSNVSMCKIDTCGSLVIEGCFGGRGGAIVLSLGSPARPHFRSIKIEEKGNGQSGQLMSSVTVEQNRQSQLENAVGSEMETEAARPRTVDAPMLLGPDQTVGSKRINAESTLSSKKMRSGDADDDGEDGTIEWMKGLVDDEGDVTLEERLEMLSSAVSEQEHVAQNGKKNGDKDGIAGAAPTSDSLVVLIEQALQSGDDALLEQCFECDDAAVVEQTAKRLPAARVVPLLTKLVAKFERRPSRGILLTRWLAAVLRFHTAHLMNVSDLNSRLAGLSQILEQRLSTYTHVAALGGRLDLLFSQSRDMSGSGGNNSSIEPKTVFYE